MRKDVFHHLTVGEHVRNATRHAQIIFQHHELAAVQANQVSADNRHIHVIRNAHAAHLPVIVFAAVDEITRDNALD